MILLLKNINKHYLIGNKVVTALNQINLELTETGLVLICGSSGSGKTTLLNIISGTDYYTEGDYYINDTDTNSFNDIDWEKTRNKYFSFIYQDFKLIEDYSVKDNVLLAYNLSKDKSIDINSIIKKVGLESVQNKKARYLSGGQKQRVAIARALAKNTPVIFADEPTANLDHNNSKKIAELLHEISKEKLVILSTHNEDLFDSFEARRITLYDGKIIKDEKNTSQAKIQPVEIDKKERCKNNKLFGLSKNKKTIFWTFFSMVMTFLITLGVFSIGLYFTNASTTSYERTKFFGNLSPDRYIVTKHDSSAFSENEIRKIESYPSVKSVNTNDVLADHFLQSYQENNSLIDFSVRRLLDLPKDYRGLYPKNDNEIILSNATGTSFIGFKKGSTNEYFVCDDYSHNLTICDTFSLNKEAANIYVTDSLYNNLNNELLLKYSNPTLEKESSRNNNFDFYFDNLCPKDILISDISSLVNNSFSVNFTFLENVVKSNKLSISDISSNKELEYKYSSRKKYVVCNTEFFSDITKQNIFQLSVFSDKTPSLGGEYNVIYPNAINDGSVSSQAVVTLILWFTVVFIVSIVLVLASYLFLRNAYKNEIKNIYIRRLLGYTKKDCLVFSFIRILVSELLAVLLTIGYYIFAINIHIKNYSFVLFSNLPITLVLILLILTSVSVFMLLLRLVISKSDPYKYIEETK